MVDKSRRLGEAGTKVVPAHVSPSVSTSTSPVSEGAAPAVGSPDGYTKGQKRPEKLFGSPGSPRSFLGSNPLGLDLHEVGGGFTPPSYDQATVNALAHPVFRRDETQTLSGDDRRTLLGFLHCR